MANSSPSMPCWPTSASRWDANQYALAILSVILAATALVIVLDVILSPAHISFAVVDASSVVAGNVVSLNLTLAVNNTSRRMWVSYGTVDVDLWYSEKDWFTTDVGTGSLPPAQRPGSTVTTTVLMSPSDDVSGLEHVGKEESTSFTVRVTAQLWFRFGRAYTRPYIVSVACNDVDFFTKDRNETFTPVSCTD